jgi:mono/diheme cytochrome c family protein
MSSPVAARGSAPGGPGAKPGTLYRRHCQRCHGRDGGGNLEKFDPTDIPDFRRPHWHRLRSDARLTASILDGTGAMPPFRRRLSEADVQGLVGHLRGFASAPPAAPPRQGARESDTREKTEEARTHPKEPTPGTLPPPDRAVAPADATTRPSPAGVPGRASTDAKKLSENPEIHHYFRQISVGFHVLG